MEWDKGSTDSRIRTKRRLKDTAQHQFDEQKIARLSFRRAQAVAFGVDEVYDNESQSAVYSTNWAENGAQNNSSEAANHLTLGARVRRREPVVRGVRNRKMSTGVLVSGVSAMMYYNYFRSTE